MIILGGREMKKRVLLLGMMVSLSWSAMGFDSDVATAFVNQGIRINVNKEGGESNSERLDKVELVNGLHETNIKNLQEKDKEQDGNTEYVLGKTGVNETNIATNTAKTEVNETNISNNKTAISDNSQRITNLDNKVDNLQGEMNKGFAMSAAMTSVDFQSLEVGEMGISVPE